MDDLVQRAVRGTGHRATKREMVRKNRSRIEASLRSGASQRSIYRELKNEGVDVGSLTAFRINLAKLGIGITDVPVRQPVSEVQSGASYADERFQSDY